MLADAHKSKALSLIYLLKGVARTVQQLLVGWWAVFLFTGLFCRVRPYLLGECVSVQSQP